MLYVKLKPYPGSFSRIYKRGVEMKRLTKKILALILAVMLTASIGVTAFAAGISSVKAQSIALSDAGVKKASALKLKVEKDRENGKSVYEVDFYVRKNGKLLEYDYTILASSGKILKKTVETEATAPKAVTGLKVKSKTASTVTLAWSKSARAKGYLVYKYNAVAKKYVKLAATSALSYKITGLKKNTAYKFAVRPYLKDEGIALACPTYTKISVRTAK